MVNISTQNWLRISMEVVKVYTENYKKSTIKMKYEKPQIN